MCILISEQSSAFEADSVLYVICMFLYRPSLDAISVVAMGISPLVIILFSEVNIKTAIRATTNGKLSVNAAPSLVSRILLACVSSTIWSPENMRSPCLKHSGQNLCEPMIIIITNNSEPYTTTISTGNGFESISWTIL